MMIHYILSKRMAALWRLCVFFFVHKDEIFIEFAISGKKRLTS